MKKIIVLIIVLTFVLSFSTQSLAAINGDVASIITPMYTNIASIGASLEISSLGIATCEGILTHRLNDGSCELTMKLQKLNTDKSWSTIATWTAEGLTKCSNYQYRAVSRGTYRVAVTGKVYDSLRNLSETQSVYSIIVTY
ncbi:MAG: hypothetical protein AAGU76_11660 [Sedimentibacter sp.]|uniref:hypothetical protein n=1 Tax=Sedimentibacter sp. TaxID=1960295 RepID=UPI003158BAD9